MPKKGASGSSSPHGSRPTLRTASSGMWIVEVVLQGAGEGADDIEPPVLPQFDVEDAHLPHMLLGCKFPS